VLLDLFRKHSQKDPQNKFKPQLFYTNIPERTFYLTSSQKTAEKQIIPYKQIILSLQQENLTKTANLNESHYQKIGSKIVDFILAILREFPLTSQIVLKTLAEKFPYKKLPIEQQYHYFKIMLAIASKSVNSEEKILGICFEKFLQIEVDSKTYWRNQIISDIVSLQFRLEKTLKRRIYTENEKKIDAILSLFYKYIDERLAKINEISDENIQKSEKEDFCDTILKLFEEKVIQSHKTNYIQFIITYLALNKDMEIFRQKFISLLLIKSANQSNFIENRIVLLNYFGSFIASCGDLLEPELIIEALKIFANDFMELRKNKGNKLGAFYIQVLAYILCYRWEIIRKNAELFDLIKEIVFGINKNIAGNQSEFIIYIEPSILHELVKLIEIQQDISWKKQGIQILENVINKQTSENIIPLNSYWFFAGINYLPITILNFSDKLAHFTVSQKKQLEEVPKENIPQRSPKLSPNSTPKRLILTKKRRESFELMDNSECINKGIKILTTSPSPRNIQFSLNYSVN